MEIETTIRKNGNQETETIFLSKLAAIKRFCLECNGFNRLAINNCDDTGCPLYLFRNEKTYSASKDFRPPTIQTLRSFCQICRPHFVDSCPVVLCPLFPFRSPAAVKQASLAGRVRKAPPPEGGFSSQTVRQKTTRIDARPSGRVKTRAPWGPGLFRS